MGGHSLRPGVGSGGAALGIDGCNGGIVGSTLRSGGTGGVAGIVGIDGTVGISGIDDTAGRQACATPVVAALRTRLFALRVRSSFGTAERVHPRTPRCNGVSPQRMQRI